MVSSNAAETLIWGGNELPETAFITSSSTVNYTVTNSYDFSDILSNNSQASDQIAHLSTGIDSYTKLYLHGNGTDGSTTITDSTSGGKAITAVDSTQIDTAYKKFGTGSILFDGTGDYATTPDHADWYFADQPFTIDYWMRYSNKLADSGICGQWKDADNYWYIKSSVNNINFKVMVGGVVKAEYSFYMGDFANNTWTHIEISRNGTTMYAFRDGVPYISVTETTAISTNEVPDLAAVLEIGASSNHANVFAGSIDEFRISKGIARHTADFTVPSSPYLPDWRYLLIGSPRPLKGIKPYVSLANTVASTLTCKEWNGSTWNSLTILDNTDTGASLARTGVVSFSSTVDTARPKFIEGYFLYWYQLYLDAGEAEIYKITLDAPFQGITDLWDGQYRDIAAAYKMTATARQDISLKVLKDDYDVDTADTYADLSSMDAYPTYMLEFGFEERMCGIHFRLPPEYVNTTAATVMSVDYWTGTQYASVGAVSDGTSENSISFSRSGTITWNNANISDETKTNKMGAQTIWSPLSDPSTTESIWGWLTIGAKNVSTPLYFYRVRFDKAMDASVRLNYVGGITTEKDVSHYKFPIFAQGRNLLCADMSAEKNKMICSAKYMPQVYNGSDSVDVYIGDEGELTCGTELFSQYGGNLYSLILIFKDTEYWVIAGQDIETWSNSIFPVSTSIGCPAPLTLKTITLSTEPSGGININRSLAIFQGANGIYMTDGRAPIPIHGDIKEYFDKSDSRCIKASMIGDSIGFMDNEKQEYHWLFASGTSTTTLNAEWVYDIIRNKWYEVDRGTGMDLQYGLDVQDIYGNQYNYGFIDTGYIERLEYGTTFDGNDIVSTFQLGDYLPADTIMAETMLDKIKLIIKAKTTTTNNISATHYGDGCTTGTTLKDCFDPNKTGYRIAMPFLTDNLGGYVFHSLKFAQTTDDETCGFEPLALGITHHIVREG
jgi:hypothetical protein